MRIIINSFVVYVTYTYTVSLKLSILRTTLCDTNYKCSITFNVWCLLVSRPHSETIKWRKKICHIFLIWKVKKISLFTYQFSCAYSTHYSMNIMAMESEFVSFPSDELICNMILRSRKQRWSAQIRQINLNGQILANWKSFSKLTVTFTFNRNKCNVCYMQIWHLNMVKWHWLDTHWRACMDICYLLCFFFYSWLFHSYTQMQIIEFVYNVFET